MPEDEGTVETLDAPNETPDQTQPSQEEPASESTDSQPTEDYQKRYDDLRPQYDRTMSELQQHKEFLGQLANPETQAEALRQLGLELDQQEAPDDDEYVDPEERLNSQLEQVQNWIQAQEEERDHQELIELQAQYLDQNISAIEKQHGQLSDGEKEAIALLALELEDDGGLPDVNAAYEKLVAAAEARSKRYIESKKAPKAPTGTAGEKPVNLDSADARAKLAAEIIEAGREDEG
jgi:hypothetical protein